jgi:hypothetical protein
MQHVRANLPALKPSQPSTAVSRKSGSLNSERLQAARKTLSTLMKGRPETSIENPDYTAEMVEVLSHLTPDEHQALTEPRDGLQTVSRYLPTPADVHGFLRDRRARLDAIRPAATTYKKLQIDDPKAPWNLPVDPERKRCIVEKHLGYDPDRKPAGPRVFTPPTAEDMANLRLNRPPAPPSPYLLKLLQEQWSKLNPEAKGQSNDQDQR